MKEPWEQYPHVWASKSKYFTWLRGVLRRGWNKAPQKIEYIRSQRIRIPNPNPRGKQDTVWGAKCEHCEQEFPQNNIQVDHIIEAGALSDWDDVGGFVQRLLGVTDDGLRLLCKECHKIITHASRYNVTFEQARIKKILAKYLKLSASEQNKIIDGYDLPSNNAAARKKSLQLLIEKKEIM